MHNQWEAAYHTLHLLFVCKPADLSIENKATPLPRERWGLCELLSTNLRNREAFSKSSSSQQPCFSTRKRNHHWDAAPAPQNHQSWRTHPKEPRNSFLFFEFSHQGHILPQPNTAQVKVTSVCDYLLLRAQWRTVFLPVAAFRQDNLSQQQNGN